MDDSSVEDGNKVGGGGITGSEKESEKMGEDGEQPGGANEEKLDGNEVRDGDGGFRRVVVKASARQGTPPPFHKAGLACMPSP